MSSCILRELLHKFSWKSSRGSTKKVNLLKESIWVFWHVVIRFCSNIFCLRLLPSFIHKTFDLTLYFDTCFPRSFLSFVYYMHFSVHWLLVLHMWLFYFYLKTYQYSLQLLQRLITDQWVGNFTAEQVKINWDSKEVDIRKEKKKEKNDLACRVNYLCWQ